MMAPRMTAPRRLQAIAAAVAAALVATMVAGCILNKPPDAAAIKEVALPTVQIPAKWTGVGAGAGVVSDNWLAGFRDDQLSAAVAEAIGHNADLRVAAARVEQAQLHAKLAGAKLWPSVDLLARGGGKLSGDGSGIQGGVLSATWEVDLWGRVRYGRAASAAQFASAQADFEYARESIAALVAKSWFLAIEAELQVQAAREAIRASEELVRLADDRTRIGVAGEEDVFVARADGGGYRDALRQLELAREQAIRALEILLGRYPSAAATTTPRLPDYPGEIPTGLPSELLERRPDVIAAERRVAVAFNRIHEAKAARLPAIALTTGVSAISSDLFLLKDHDNPVWNVGANLLAPIFRGGALKTQVEIRTAEQKQAIAEYAAVGLRAFGEVESALAAEIAAREREQILTQSFADYRQAVTLVQTQFKVGSTDLRFVEQRQLALNATRSSLIRVQAEQRVQRVNLHLALGGSFEPSPATPTPAVPVGATH
jgi:NodT family efflux transporter outer membrane factor (OMF) lipoprotein